MFSLETRFDGRRFRARNEARYASFFKSLGIRYDYESQGFRLKSGCYLPDFYLPDWSLYVETKGEYPTPLAMALCADLASESECEVLLAIGSPLHDTRTLYFPPKGGMQAITWWQYWWEWEKIPDWRVRHALIVAQSQRFDKTDDPGQYCLDLVPCDT